jgi:hypothetical protein
MIREPLSVATMGRIAAVAGFFAAGGALFGILIDTIGRLP